MRFAVDTGGTFTDLVIEDDDGRLSIYKRSTTPADPVQGILDVFEVAARERGVERDRLLAGGSVLIHGTTRALNAVITGTTARTAFLTTEGHPDILVLREGGRPSSSTCRRPYPEPYVPRALTFEVPERISADGRSCSRSTRRPCREIVRELRAQRRRGGRRVPAVVDRQPGARAARSGELAGRACPRPPFTLSHALNPCLREYRRASSTVIDASLKPLMTRVPRAACGAAARGGFAGRLLIVTSAGGAARRRGDRRGADPLAQLGPVDGARRRPALRQG